MSLSQLTIVIVTLERQAAAIRQAKYLYGRVGQVIVLDGSTIPHPELVKQALDDPNVEYLFGTRGLSARFRNCCGLIKGKYVMTFTDDDLFLMSSAKSLFSFLDDNPDYTAYGLSIVAYQLKGYWGLNMWNPPYSQLENREINSALPFERTKNHFSNYVTTYLYSLVKTEVWESIFSHLQIEPEELSSPYVYELYIEYLGALFSKAKILPQISTIRIKGFQPRLANANKEYHKNLPVYIWIKEQSNHLEIAYLTNSVVDISKKVLPDYSSQLVSGNFIECLFSFAEIEEDWFYENSDKVNDVLRIRLIIVSVKVRIFSLVARTSKKFWRLLVQKQINGRLSIFRQTIWKEEFEEIMGRLSAMEREEL